MELYGHGRHARGVYGRAAEPHGLAVRREVLDEQAVRAAAREPGVALLEGWSARRAPARRERARPRPGGHRSGRRAARAPRALHDRRRWAGEPRGARARRLGAPPLARSLRPDGPRPARRARGAQRGALRSRRLPGAGPRRRRARHAQPGRRPRRSPPRPCGARWLLRRAAGPRGAPPRARLPPSELEIRACGPLAARTRRQTFDGAALVGDACGYVDPITGEGTYFAMRGAALLSECLDRALHAGASDRAALGPYLAARRREFAHRRALGLLLQRGLRHPRVVAGVLALLAARPRLTDLLVEVTGAGRPPRELLRPALWVDVLAPQRSSAGTA